MTVLLLDVMMDVSMSGDGVYRDSGRVCFVVLSGLMFRVLSIATKTGTVSPERGRESCTGTRRACYGGLRGTTGTLRAHYGTGRPGWG